MGMWKNSPEKMFITFEVIIEISMWESIEDHISVTKVSITLKNFEEFLRNLRHNQKSSNRRFVENFKYVGKVGEDFLPKQCIVKIINLELRT